MVTPTQARTFLGVAASLGLAVCYLTLSGRCISAEEDSAQMVDSRKTALTAVQAIQKKIKTSNAYNRKFPNS